MTRLQRSVNKMRKVSLLALIGAVLAGCSAAPVDGVSTTSSPATAGQQSSVERLLSQQWRLLTIEANGLEADASGAKVFIAFNTEKQQVFGFAGCNNYFGQYSVTENTLTFSYLGMTRKMCHTAMALEGKFSQMTSKVASYGFSGDFLHLYDEQKQLLATLAKF